MNGILYPLKLHNIAKNILEYYSNADLLLKDYQNNSLLWFIYSAYNFIEHTGEWKFVKEKLWPKMKLIINFYLSGKFNEIKIDNDGLLFTNFKKEGYSIPGKYVDINALWYNIIRIVELFSAKFTDIDYHLKASEFGYKIKKNFFKKFWNNKKGYLNNCVEIPPDKSIDSSLRPNQVLTISLPFNDLLNTKTKGEILKILKESLFSLNGMKTLSSDSIHFNCNDLYNGALSIEWWSEFIIAYLKFNRFNRASKKEAHFLITQLEKNFKTRVIGHLPEALSSDENILPVGKPASIKSISSFVRLLYEILGKF